MSDSAPSAHGSVSDDERPWIVPRPFDGSSASLGEHAEAIAAMMAGRARVWLGPFALPDALAGRAGDGEKDGAGRDGEDLLADVALVVPTSGSTGEPKAVALTLAALLASQDATSEALGGHGLWLPLLPPTHIAGIQIIARACRAAQLLGHDEPLMAHPLPRLADHFDAAAFCRAAEPALIRAAELGVPAYTSVVPTQLVRLLGDSDSAGADDDSSAPEPRGAPTSAARARALLARFDAVLVGGAATPPALLDAALAAGVRAVTTYGSSETAGGCVYDGRPLAGVELTTDQSGRLRIDSPTLAIAHVLADGSAASLPRPLATSDLARVQEGTLHILGRADDVIITGGRKVLPQDVERALVTSPLLATLLEEVVVVGVPDEQWGHRIVALAVPKPDARSADMHTRMVRALHQAGLPAHAVPKATHVIDELPLLGIGKIDRAAAQRIAIGLADAAEASHTEPDQAHGHGPGPAEVGGA